MGFAFAGPADAAPVNFQFLNNTAFDNQPSGVTMTKDGITITSVEVKAPYYVVTDPVGAPTVLTWDGSTYIPSETSIQSDVSGLGVNNDSISNTPISSESQSFHPGESWTLKFDQDVRFTQILFVSFEHSGDQVTITIDGEDPWVFTSTGGGAQNTKNNPFGTLAIPADTNITFTNTNTIPTTLSTTAATDVTGWRIHGFTVEIPPPPQPGDYNNDGIVDAADYVLWRDVLGGPADSLLNRDPENEDSINPADYDFWKANFGNPSALASGTTVNAVPEPMALVGIVLLGLGAMGLHRRGKYS